MAGGCQVPGSSGCLLTGRSSACKVGSRSCTCHEQQTELMCKGTVGSCAQLWSPGEAPYARRDLVGAVRQRLLGSARAAGAGTVPAPSPAGAHVLSHKQGSSSSCQALSEATHTSASGCTCTFSQVPQCLADSLDSLPLGNQAQKKGHSPHISATAGVIRQTSVKET